MTSSIDPPSKNLAFNQSAIEPFTIQRVADDLGVHYSTVSLALSGKGRVAPATRARVLSYAAQVGFEPDARAQSLRRRADSNVICLCSGVFDAGRANQKIALIQNALTSAGWEVPIYSPSGKPITREFQGKPQAALIQQLRRQRPRAIICSAHSLQDTAFDELALYQRDGGLVVSYDEPVPLSCDQVVFDREDNAYQGARYLLERGHRDIGIAMSPISKNLVNADTVANTIPHNLRFRGFLRALNEFNVRLRDEWLFFGPALEQGGAELAHRFLSLAKRPSGLCIVNDYTALGFMVEVTRAGVRVPEDLSIIGHENQPVATFCPVPLTSISQPADDIVAAVVRTTLDRINGDTQPPRTITLRSNIVERQSVAPVGAV